MKLTQIREAILERVAAWTGIDKDSIDYPNNPNGVFDPGTRQIWARISDSPGLATAPEIGIGACVRRTGMVTIQLFVPTNSGTLAITTAADTLVEQFQFYSDPAYPIEFYATSSYVIGDDGRGWYQVNVTTPYRAY